MMRRVGDWLMAEHMLSTIDNPFNPFTQFDEWDAWDRRMGYHTLAYLARIVVTSHDLSPADESQAIEDAINEIVEENVLGIYIRVTADWKVKVVQVATT